MSVTQIALQITITDISKRLLKTSSTGGTTDAETIWPDRNTCSQKQFHISAAHKPLSHMRTHLICPFRLLYFTLLIIRTQILWLVIAALIGSAYLPNFGSGNITDRKFILFLFFPAPLKGLHIYWNKTNTVTFNVTNNHTDNSFAKTALVTVNGVTFCTSPPSMERAYFTDCIWENSVPAVCSRTQKLQTNFITATARAFALLRYDLNRQRTELRADLRAVQSPAASLQICIGKYVGWICNDDPQRRRQQKMAGGPAAPLLSSAHRDPRQSSSRSSGTPP